ncbi:MAG TPA: hypothetical protein VIG64_04070 [Actinomycetota bacterium]
MSALVVGVLATALAAVVTYIFNGFRTRREAAARALIGALRDGQRSSFLLDLDNDDHSRLILEPLGAWRRLVQAQTGERLTAERTTEKIDQLLGWRMDEREFRIAFAIMAPALSVRKLARVLLAHQRRLVAEGARHIEWQDPYFHESTQRLIQVVVSIRVATWFVPVHALLRRVPGVGSMLVRDEDIRMLVADYSELRPVSPFGAGLSEIAAPH